MLVRLDSYRGASHKLKNRWGSTLHTVVGHIAEDVPTYVIRNDKDKEKVLHRVRLLLWSSAEEEEEGIQMTTAQLTIFVSLLELEPLLNGEERCVRSGVINSDSVRCILDAAKIVYCFGQMTSVTDDLSMGLTSAPA